MLALAFLVGLKETLPRDFHHVLPDGFTAERVVTVTLRPMALAIDAKPPRDGGRAFTFTRAVTWAADATIE